MKRPLSPHTTGGFTIVEAAFAAAISAIALASLFAFNSSCLSLVRNAKESASAMLSNQQRVEQMRSCNWSQITDKDYMSQSVMNAATQSGSSLGNATEIVRVTENAFLQGASACYYELTRAPSGTSLSAHYNETSLINSRMLKVNVTLSWTTLGGRARTRTSTAIIARGGLTINETTTIAPTVTW